MNTKNSILIVAINIVITILICYIMMRWCGCCDTAESAAELERIEVVEPEATNEGAEILSTSETASTDVSIANKTKGLEEKTEKKQG